MKMILALLLMLYTQYVFAMTYWPTNYISGVLPLNTLSDIRQLTDVYDCGETEGTQFCGFELDYRGIEFDAELTVSGQNITKIVFTTPFSVSVFTRLQTLLRADNYQLEWVKINGKQLVVEELVNSDGAQIADKKLVEFLNLYPISASKQFTWIRKNEIQNTLATETLLMTSDKETIKLIWLR